ncbi:MAG: hypothetical protein DF280_02235 ['Brassica napus' phytoplasma]|nr:MAG: hypothetical protein DF280_02235 ['Brassica napus' phytoplasma]
MHLTIFFLYFTLTYFFSFICPIFHFTYFSFILKPFIFFFFVVVVLIFFIYKEIPTKKHKKNKEN